MSIMPHIDLTLDAYYYRSITRVEGVASDSEEWVVRQRERLEWLKLTGEPATGAQVTSV
jgi:hypothetical protein